MKSVRAPAPRAGRRAPAPRGLIILAAAILVGGASVIEVWPDPPGWLRPGRRVDLRVLHWLDIHWLNAAAIAAIAAVAAALIQLYIWLHDRRQKQRSPSQQARERDTMLRKVRRKWITEILEPDLGHAITLILGLHTRPDLLHIPKGPPRGPGSGPEPVPEQKSILQVFEEAAGPLVIVGAPGAGKTTLLLQLATALIDRAEHDPFQAIPVVIKLESWAAHRLALDKWLLGELTGSYYKVPLKTATDWIESGELILLLDGLDEVEERHRAECVAAINDYQRDRGLNGLVVCSRTRELQQMTVKLEQLEEAVELQPLTDAQTSAFLDYLEMTGTPVHTVRAALATDEPLRELLSSPLMLNVVALAYNGRTPTALEQHGTLTEHEERLWQAYVERMFDQRPLPRRCRYTREQAVTWLGWLARALQENSHSEFQLDRLTSKWLPKKSERWARLDLHVLQGEQSQEALKLEYGSILILIHAFGVVLIAILETLAAALYAGTGAGVAVGLIAGPVPGLISALATGAGTLLVGVPFQALELLTSLISRTANQNRRPNEGIRRSARHGLNTGLAAFLVFGGIAWLGFWLSFRPNLGLYFGLSLGLWFGWYYGMKSGGSIFIQHYEVRAALVRAGAAPWRYQAFLDAMAARLLLRRSGGSYQFTHRLLRDYLARNYDGRASGVQNAQ